MERFETAEGELDPTRVPAGLSVILFSAMTVETLLNELTELASQHGPREPQAKTLAEALEEVEESRGSIRLKLLIATIALGKPVEKGHEPYQSFDLLFKVRDAIVHLKPYRHTFTGTGIEAEPRGLLNALHARGLVPDPTVLPAQSFLSTVASAALCRWAVQTAREVVSNAVSLLPEGDLKKHVQFLLADVLGIERAALTEAPRTL
ncbi:MAG TPA: hypothetical protein VN461_00810 [Vicinamibacteria bacterium]|nr:hypothetical protein [Vicinamibacteria bacterium]